MRTPASPSRDAKVAIGTDVECAENILHSGPRTDAAGRVSRMFDDAQGFLTCTWPPLPVPPPTSQWSLGYADWTTFAVYGVRLSAAPARATVHAGSSTTVDGNVLAVGGDRTRAAAAGSHVRLQRLAGRSWRNVNIATVTTSARFHLTATPPSKGRHVYRVWFPSQTRFAGTASRSFVITAI